MKLCKKSGLLCSLEHWKILLQDNFCCFPLNVYSMLYLPNNSSTNIQTYTHTHIYLSVEGQKYNNNNSNTIMCMADRLNLRNGGGGGWGKEEGAWWGREEHVKKLHDRMIKTQRMFVRLRPYIHTYIIFQVLSAGLFSNLFTTNARFGG